MTGTQLQHSKLDGAGTALLGGTFDPIHIGHLRTAVELKEALNAREVRLIPSAQPPHRSNPLRKPEQRLAMLELAIANEPGLVADDCELQRQGNSYTIDTLKQQRERVGATTPLHLCIGMDAFCQLHRWHQWEYFLDYANIVVAARPSWEQPKTGIMAAFIDKFSPVDLGSLQYSPAGQLSIATMTALPISATAIRAALDAGRSIRYLVPDAVNTYIHQQQLYRTPITE